MIKNLLFDCFGTLVHFAENSFVSESHGEKPATSAGDLQSFLRSQGQNFTISQIEDALLSSRTKAASLITEEFNEIPSEIRFGYFCDALNLNHDLALDCVRVHMDYMKDNTYIEDSLHSVLADLQQNYKMSLLSNFDWHEGLCNILKKYDLEKYFEVIMSSHSIGYRKPGTKIFEAGIAQASYCINETLYIGDVYLYDVQGPAGIGMKSLLISEECVESNEYLCAQINSLSQITDFLQSQ